MMELTVDCLLILLSSSALHMEAIKYAAGRRQEKPSRSSRTDWKSYSRE